MRPKITITIILLLLALVGAAMLQFVLLAG